ncbi:ArsR/SmtB family transcription factor [Virgibacillus sp. W0181]|uniref:ArsR/SmtB family transcription factor n=1 Tax=Virgibacillus sp. W0181 TaxID=3391581 RepID=UPI003F4862D6
MSSYETTEETLKAIGEETRLKIISYLTFDTFCVCELVELLHMSQPSISQHIRRLKQANIVLEERKGKWVFYSLNNQHDLYHLLLHVVSTLPSVASQIKDLEADGKRIICE